MMTNTTLEHQDTVLLADDIHVPNFMTGNVDSDKYLRGIQGMVFDANNHGDRLELVEQQIAGFDLDFILPDVEEATGDHVLNTLSTWRVTLANALDVPERPAVKSGGFFSKWFKRSPAAEPTEPAIFKPKYHDHAFLSPPLRLKDQIKDGLEKIDLNKSDRKRNVAKIEALEHNNEILGCLIESGEAHITALRATSKGETE